MVDYSEYDANEDGVLQSKELRDIANAIPPEERSEALKLIADTLDGMCEAPADENRELGNAIAALGIDRVLNDEVAPPEGADLQTIIVNELTNLFAGAAFPKDEKLSEAFKRFDASDFDQMSHDVCPGSASLPQNPDKSTRSV